MSILLPLVLGAIRTAAAEPSAGADAPAKGPLRVLRSNPRYFTDGSGRAVYLTGSHVWNTLSDMGATDPPPPFDWDAFLDFQQEHGHNFIRLWRWELLRWDLTTAAQWTGQEGPHVIAPHPWKRTGPGRATDGKPRFDLTQFDPAYFARLRSRVESAGRRGIYVSVMLFEGWAAQNAPEAWKWHPFHAPNNVNGIEADRDGDGLGLEAYTLRVPEVLELQEAYVRKVIATVGDLDNVLYEIANESGAYSTDWQYHLIRLIKAEEKQRPKQHPVGMTFQYSRDKSRRGTNRLLFESPADWVSPNPDAPGGHNYRDNPPPADGRKVILTDTDHLWGIGGNPDWAWKSLLRGLNPLFMDPYDHRILGKGSPKQWEPLRRTLGHTRRLADRLDLARMIPDGQLSSTAYCLAEPGFKYLAYQPDSGPFTLDLEAAEGTLTSEWIDPASGAASPGPNIEGRAVRTFTPPNKGPALLLVETVPRQ